MKRLCLAAAIAAGLVCMRAYALLEVSGDYTITTGTIDVPLVFTGDANLTIAENVGSSTSLGVFLGTVTNDGRNVTINMESGCKAQVNWFQNLNGATMKINFKGGRFTDGGGWGARWFKTPAGCTVELASVDGSCRPVCGRLHRRREAQGRRDDVRASGRERQDWHRQKARGQSQFRRWLTRLGGVEKQKRYSS